MLWQSPQAFWLFIPLSLIALYYFSKGRKKKRAFYVGFTAPFSFRNTLRAKLIELPALLQFLSLFILIIALARPQSVQTQVGRSADGIDIIIVLDISDSMLIRDMEPASRIEAAKKVITNFVSALVYDRVGLIVFSGESYTREPLTLDYEVILRSVDQVRVSHYDPHIKKGTAIGVALANAVARLNKSQAKSKVVVFLTDGEDNVGVISPQTALDIVKQYDIKVYTIGVGGKAGMATIGREVRDHIGRKRVIYQKIETKINEELLKKIANETGGQYFRANNEKALQEIFSAISKMEKSKVDLPKWKQYQEHFPKIVEKSALLYFIALLLSFSFFWRTI